MSKSKAERLVIGSALAADLRRAAQNEAVSPSKPIVLVDRDGKPTRHISRHEFRRAAAARAGIELDVQPGVRPKKKICTRCGALMTIPPHGRVFDACTLGCPELRTQVQSLIDSGGTATSITKQLRSQGNACSRASIGRLMHLLGVRRAIAHTKRRRKPLPSRLRWPPRVKRSGPGRREIEFTPPERRLILSMMARRCSAREISERLHASRATVGRIMRAIVRASA